MIKCVKISWSFQFITSYGEQGKATKTGAGQYFDGLQFKKVFYSIGFIPKGNYSKIFIPKVHYSEIWNDDPSG